MKIAIIGGSLLSEFSGFGEATEERIKNPFGEPSSNFTIGEINGSEVIYLNRHGQPHHLAPHQINYRANMFALKMLDVTDIVSVTAVGGITENMTPMQWVVADQLIDYTYGRMQTYNDCNENGVHHIDFTFPFTHSVRQKIITAAKIENFQCITQATYGATQGPRLETAAEINRLEKDGCDIVGMTVMPEAALARELEINYATLSLVVNRAAGKGARVKSKKNNVIQGTNLQGAELQRAETISMKEISRRIDEGNEIAERIIRAICTRHE